MYNRRIGLIVNPVAGMGGKVGLKGTDGKDMYLKAVSMGAQPEVGLKVTRALECLKTLDETYEFVTCNGVMGEDILKDCGIENRLVIKVCQGKESTPEDTVEAVDRMIKAAVDLILFAGGDGTARLIAQVMSEKSIPCLGIPSGVKIQSSVFATTPRQAGDILKDYIQNKSMTFNAGEVVDLDEELYRQGIVAPKFHGVLQVPSVAHKMQSKKARTQNEEKADQMMIATEVVHQMQKDTLYFIGPGSTTQSVMNKLGVSSTLIGVDAVLNNQLIGLDLTESDILDLAELMESKVILTPIGGQGFLLGRGNHQFSGPVLKKIGVKNLMVVSTKNKINTLPDRGFLVDTGDDVLDKKIRGYTRVITGIKEEMVIRIR